MAALAQCDAFAYIYDQAGDPAPDILVVLKRVLDASGNPILLGPKTTLTDSAGAFHFTLPELGTAFISARASALWNCPEGRAFTVPPGPSGELVPDFSLPASTLVEPPLVYVGDVLSIPKASETQDGYLSAADFVRFEAGAADMGITQINTGAGLTGGPITETGTISLLPISGVAGTWENPTSISINAYGQIIAIVATADTTAPVISAISAAPTGSGATITWATDDFSDSQVEYGTTTSYGTTTTLATTPVLSHSVPITGTPPLTLYHYRVKSRNTAGLLTTSGDNTFTTTAVTDTTPPVISAITATSITDTGATITWTTDEASDSQVEYGLTTSYGSTTTLNATMVTSHSVPITGTAATTLYHYRVKSRNAAGLLTTSGDNTFTTTAAVNTLLTGLISMWKMDEPGTTEPRVDSHGANNLSINPAVSSGTGKISQAVHIDIGQLLYATDNLSLETGPIDYTWAFWVKLDALNDCAFFGKSGDTVRDEYFCGYYPGATPASTGRFRFTVQGAGTFATVLADAFGPPVTGQWYFVVCWHDQTAGTLNIQINNGAIDSFTPVPPLVGADQDLFFGAYGYHVANPMAGLLDEVAFWKHILTTGDKTALYGGGGGLAFGSWQ
jgi:hypothetical protein